MANYGEEAADLARIGGSLVINMGTVTPDGIANYMQALKAYNAHGGPVLLYVPPEPNYHFLAVFRPAIYVCTVIHLTGLTVGSAHTRA